MLSGRNLSPRQLALYTATILAVPVSLGIFLVTANWKIGLGTLCLVFGGGYGLIHFTLERFIYRKIKLIYKQIHQTKTSRREEVYNKYILPQKSMEDVRKDVEEWGEKQRLQIESLQQNEAFRKEFLQNLSHEFKTPVFAIQGYIETLLDGGLEDEQISRRFLEKAFKNTSRLVHLVNDLDEITKLETGKLTLYKQRFVIQDLIQEVFDALTIKTQTKHIQCSIKKGCEGPHTVFADKEKIKQVLINLIANASKYGKDGGNIVASIYATDGKHFLVEISDDGNGIEAEHLPRIFERFYRTDDARSRDKGGSGLGLSICKHIIEAHGQSIHVRSTPNVGTTIGFTLEAHH